MRLERLSSNHRSLDAPGLPTLFAAGDKWVSWTSALPMPRAAAALRQPPGPWFGRAPGFDIADEGEIPIDLEKDDGAGDAPDPVMLDAARWLLAHDADFTQVVLDTLVADLPRLRDIENAVVLGDDDFRLPRQWDAAMASSLVWLETINLPPVAGHAPYIGVGFRCAWEPEHGYGLMLCGTEVVERGGADTAVLSWIAARHAEDQGG